MATTIKWYLAHQPIHLVRRTAEAFRNLLVMETDGAYDVEILSPADYKNKYDATWDWSAQGFDVSPLLSSNAVQMSQTDLYELANPGDANFYLFDMPFLFDDHDQARRVIDRPIGESLNRRLNNLDVGYQGLAYTYSGGYRALGSTKSITALSDVKDSNMRVNGNPVTRDFWQELGVKGNYAPQKDVWTADHCESIGVSSVDTTYIRFEQAPHWFKTDHSLYLTDILISTEFWNTLDQGTQNIWRDCAKRAAEQERAWAMQDAEQYEANNPDKIVTATAEELAEMREKSRAVYDKWESSFSPGLIKAIRDLA